jgi:hypothetical protein
MPGTAQSRTGISLLLAYGLKTSDQLVSKNSYHRLEAADSDFCFARYRGFWLLQQPEERLTLRSVGWRITTILRPQIVL